MFFIYEAFRHSLVPDLDRLSAPLPSAGDPRLLFAGDATDPRHFSTLHGARLSGLREAERIIRRIRERENVEREIVRIASASEFFPDSSLPYVANGTASSVLSGSSRGNSLERRRLVMAASTLPRGGLT